MLLISHRGNLNGPNSDLENNPDYIESAIKNNFNVEIDVFYKDGSLWLGHDFPQYKITDINWLKNDYIWCHAKNIEALHFLSNFNDIHYFWHQNDDVTLTSKGYIWTFPNKKICKKSIIVIQENILVEQMPDCYGICSDFVANLKN